MSARPAPPGTAAADPALRRDNRARAMLDVGRKPWNAAIRVLLGTPNPAYGATKAGRGLLMRLVLGETLEDVFTDDDIVRKLAATAPVAPTAPGGGGLP